ncbi:unnamed protein product [Miscanthus lutarioriparius]|uniref:Uncharacterized protein n=1 Tax=Miscanthus lutarioriparius TaxID=422564 RepID=A0A811M8J3_9POAL|nr:unnamed protein product [Miscanthus lutarioriparius]
MCAQILKFKPDLVITEKGLSDLAIHYLSKAGVSAIRRLRKTDNNRIAKACGAVIVNRPEELQESDVGTGAGLFEVKKIGDELFAFIVDCKDPKACTVLLSGASKDVLNEVERNLQDAMSVARNILKNPKLLPGGGATELTVSATLKQKSSSVEGVEKHANGENAWVGIDGRSGDIVDMKERKGQPFGSTSSMRKPGNTAHGVYAQPSTSSNGAGALSGPPGPPFFMVYSYEQGSNHGASSSEPIEFDLLGHFLQQMVMAYQGRHAK